MQTQQLTLRKKLKYMLVFSVFESQFLYIETKSNAAMKPSSLLKREAVLQLQSLKQNTFIITLAAMATQIQN